MTTEVVVIGGGLSGLAAAVQLSIDGADVVLLERAAKLGGRAYSYIDAKTGDVVDNGQHILVGAYHHTLRYLELVGTRQYLAASDAGDLHLHFHHPEKGFVSFDLASFSNPLRIPVGIVKSQLLSLRDWQKMVNIGIQLMSWNSYLEEKLRRFSIVEWLDNMGQSEEAKRSFWFPIAVSVMNELPEKASALLFARSINNTFLRKKSDATVLIPSIGQSELYVAAAKNILTTRKSKILLNTEATSVTLRRGNAIGVKLSNGRKIEAKSIISAVPYFAATRLLPEQLRQLEPFVAFKKFESSPIISIHLWFDRAIMDGEFLGLIDRNIQWLFNRRRIFREKGKAENYLTAVISGAHDCLDLSKHQLVKMAIKDIASAFPAAGTASILHSVIIKEKRATFSPTNEIESFRPSQKTRIENFYLAGDWTDTGLPATIEGAVKSGFHCAGLIH